MPDFSKLLSKPAGEAKKPPVLPIGDYPAIIKSYSYGDDNKNKTPYVRLQVGLLDWPADIDGEAREGIDLSKRQMRKDFFLTDDSLWRLEEFQRSCGITLEGQTIETTIPELVGKQIIAEVRQYLNTNSNELGNQIDKMLGSES